MFSGRAGGGRQDGSQPRDARCGKPGRAGANGLVYLAYGTRETSDITYYPRSKKFAIRGIGLIGRIEPLDYWEGEE